MAKSTQVDVVRIWQVRDNPPAYEAATPDGSLIHAEDENFRLQDLVEIGTEYGVTRWAEHIPGDGLGLDQLVVLIGWADAPIARDDVARSYHREGTQPPMVNVKVHDTELPKDGAFTELVGEFDGELDARLAALRPSELRTLITQFIEQDHADTIFWTVCEDSFELAKDDATTFFPDHPVVISREGRNGGWLVVDGLPNVDTWGPDLLTAWVGFEAACQAQVADIPRAMAWHVLANYQDGLAGRVVRVALTLTLADEDLYELGNNPSAWDWKTMLGLGSDSTITIGRK